MTGRNFFIDDVLQRKLQLRWRTNNLGSKFRGSIPVIYGYTMSNYLRKTYFCPTNYRSVNSCCADMLLSPPGLVIAVVVLGQAPRIGSIHTHDVDLAAIQIATGYIGVGGENNPLAVRREACALRVISLGEFL